MTPFLPAEPRQMGISAAWAKRASKTICFLSRGYGIKGK
jgi:hypothetical protein